MTLNEDATSPTCMMLSFEYPPLDAVTVCPFSGSNNMEDEGKTESDLNLVTM